MDPVEDVSEGPQINVVGDRGHLQVHQSTFRELHPAQFGRQREGQLHVGTLS